MFSTQIERAVEEVAIAARETEKEFIFQTILPFAQRISEKIINKEELKKAFMQYQKENMEILWYQEEVKRLQARLKNSVELPCEIGSTVYVTMNRGLKTDVVPGTVRNVLRDSNNIWWLVFSDLWVDINFEDFGKKVFLTEAEAEQALAERKNNG